MAVFSDIGDTVVSAIAEKLSDCMRLNFWLRELKCKSPVYPYLLYFVSLERKLIAECSKNYH